MEKKLHAFLYAAWKQKILHAFHTRFAPCKNLSSIHWYHISKMALHRLCCITFPNGTMCPPNAFSASIRPTFRTFIHKIACGHNSKLNPIYPWDMHVLVDSKSTNSKCEFTLVRVENTSMQVSRFGDKNNRSCSTEVQSHVQVNASMKSENANKQPKVTAQDYGPRSHQIITRCCKKRVWQRQPPFPQFCWTWW